MLFKKGDVVKCPSIWGDKTTFVIENFWGNNYCRMAYSQMRGKPDVARYKCNLNTCDIWLIDARMRPLRKLTVTQLEMLQGRGNKEAERELFIRNIKDVC